MQLDQQPAEAQAIITDLFRKLRTLAQDTFAAEGPFDPIHMTVVRIVQRHELVLLPRDVNARALSNPDALGRLMQRAMSEPLTQGTRLLLGLHEVLREGRDADLVGFASVSLGHTMARWVKNQAEAEQAQADFHTGKGVTPCITLALRFGDYGYSAALLAPDYKLNGEQTGIMEAAGRLVGLPEPELPQV
jgi:hypothetical protein